MAGVTHAAQSIYVGCAFPLWMQWALVFYAASIFALFINFYFKSYIQPTRTRSQVVRLLVNCQIVNVVVVFTMFDDRRSDKRRQDSNHRYTDKDGMDR